jgi:anaerobic magnesium-protoporphyrin IX monomethyl ester cyclase
VSLETVLLTPPLAARDRMGDLHEAGAVMPGLGILYLAANLRKHGHAVRVIDAEGLGMDIQTAADLLCEIAPKVLGIGTTTLSQSNAAEVAAAVKARRPETLVVLGGPHVTALPMETMEQYPAIDACILGDGETSFLALVENALCGRELGLGVDGVLWRADGQIQEHKKSRHLSELDSLPFPAWDLLDRFPGLYRPPFHSYRRLPVANIVTSRGCPGVCSFCDRSVFGQKAHFHSIDYILEMVAYLVKDFGIREIAIKDDMFTVSKERVGEFCARLRDRGLDVVWSCNARVNSVDRDMLGRMKRAGCWMISYGIESGSPAMLRKMMKGATLEQAKRALRYTREAGIVSKGFFLLGIPGETRESLTETVDFMRGLELDEMSLNFFTPFPGSKLYAEILAEGFKPDFSRMSMQEVVYLPKGLDEPELRRFQKKMIRSFYLRPGKLLGYFLRGLGDMGELKRLWRMGKTFASLVASGLRRKFSRAGKPRSGQAGAA